MPIAQRRNCFQHRLPPALSTTARMGGNDAPRWESLLPFWITSGRAVAVAENYRSRIAYTSPLSSASRMTSKMLPPYLWLRAYSTRHGQTAFGQFGFISAFLRCTVRSGNLGSWRCVAPKEGLRNHSSSFGSYQKNGVTIKTEGPNKGYPRNRAPCTRAKRSTSVLMAVSTVSS